MTFDSLSVPLHSILSTKFEQPTFGSNYLTFEVKPSADGGLTNGTAVEVRFKDRAMFEFVSLLEKTRERAIYMKRQVASEDDERLRMSEFIALVIDSDFNNDLTATYTSPAESSTVSMVAGVPIDNPPGYDV